MCRTLQGSGLLFQAKLELGAVTSSELHSKGTLAHVLRISTMGKRVEAGDALRCH